MVSEVYRWVRQTRRGLLDYCASLPGEAYTKHHESFGHGSMHRTMLHIADCYRFWLAETTMGQSKAVFSAERHPDAAAIDRLFAGTVDPMVEDFLTAHSGSALARSLELHVRWQPTPLRVTPIWLMTHVITHEFHHKGQVVAFGRLLGYPPPETDLCLPSVLS